MNRLIVAVLAAFDALLAAAGGLALALAPLTLLWVFGLGVGAEWGALWPVSSTLWQLGHFVPVTVTLPDTYLAATGIDPAAATFVISLAPLAFAVFTALFAARSGSRAAAAGDPVTGVVAGSLVFVGLAVAVAFTGSAAPIAGVERWQAIVLPAAVYVVPVVCGAVVGAWVHDVAPLSRLRTRVADLAGAWPLVPGLIVRGTAIAAAGLVGVGALALAAAVIVRGPQVVALFQAGNVDVIGAVVLAVAQLLYLPTLLVWAVSFVAGPGFALGEGSAVSPAGTQTGVVPAVPVLGLVPESTSPWMLLLALVPVAVGVLTGWMLRARLTSDPAGDAVGPRIVVTAGVAVATGALAALVAACASGSIGPGRLALVGPDPGPLALAVGLEVALGAGILLLSPRRASDPDEVAVPDPVTRAGAPDTGLFAGLARFDDAERPAGDAAALTDEPERPAAHVEPPADDAEAPTDEPEPPAAETIPADEQETAPIVGIERGSARRPPAEDEGAAPVD